MLNQGRLFKKKQLGEGMKSEAQFKMPYRQLGVRIYIPEEKARIEI